MMEFERPLMEKSAEMLCRGGGHILNVGFGCGIIDTAIQRHRVASHTIVEGHPAVYRRMIQAGWARKRNVRIIHERWENVDWWNYAGRFDGVYFDPFPLDAVPYEQVLWRECLIKVLKPDTGVFVLYGPTLNRSKVRREAARFRKRAVLDSVDSCVVDVAFPTPEWQELGVGRHRVEVFSLRIPSRRWNQR